MVGATSAAATGDTWAGMGVVLGGPADQVWAAEVADLAVVDLLWAVAAVVADRVDLLWAEAAVVADQVDLLWAVAAVVADRVDLGLHPVLLTRA